MTDNPFDDVPKPITVDLREIDHATLVVKLEESISEDEADYLVRELGHSSENYTRNLRKIASVLKTMDLITTIAGKLV